MKTDKIEVKITIIGDNSAKSMMTLGRIQFGKSSQTYNCCLLFSQYKSNYTNRTMKRLEKKFSRHQKRTIYAARRYEREAEPEVQVEV